MTTADPADLPTAAQPVTSGHALTGRQRALLEALKDVDPRLAEMFLGAISVLQQPFNTERFSQAGHTLREMINKMPASLGLTTTALDERMGDHLQQPEQLWATAVKSSSCYNGKSWSGEIDRHLTRALVAIHKFFEWKKAHRPRRADEMTEVVRKLDASRQQQPKNLETLTVETWNQFRDYFIAICHYRKQAEEGEFLGYLDAFEDFVINRIRPRVFADFEAIDKIIEEAGHGIPA